MTQAHEETQQHTRHPFTTFVIEALHQLRPLLLGVPLLTLITGLLFPVVLALLARPVFPRQAEGSLVRQDGMVIGSELIGQEYAAPGYFHSRPAAIREKGYDPLASGGSNLGPANPKLRDNVRTATEDYRHINGLPADAPVPIDAVTASASGLDPHISPENAALQIPRVAEARRMAEDEVRRLVVEHMQARQFGFLGEPRVNVLTLNLALDQVAPLPAADHNNPHGVSE